MDIVNKLKQYATDQQIREGNEEQNERGEIIDDKDMRRLRRWLESAKADHRETTIKAYTLISKLRLDEENSAYWKQIIEHIANTDSYISNALQLVSLSQATREDTCYTENPS